MKTEAAFTYDIELDEKALVEETPDGVIIEGYAANHDVDRQDEAFETGVFEKALGEYMKNPVLCFHHKYDQPVGRVLDAHVDQKGLFVKAIVDNAEPGTPAADIVRKVKSRTIGAFSVGGKFFRKQTKRGMRIIGMDLREISITALPVNPGTLYAVAGKAFGDEDPELIALAERLEDVLTDVKAAEAQL